MKTRKNLTEKEKEGKKDGKKEEKEGPADIFSALMTSEPRPELRLTGIYGDINEERSSEAVYGLQALHLAGTEKALSDPENEESEIITTYQPIEFIISTHGGLAADMFSVYDVMRELRDLSPINTKGIGKVMSAGVLLLAAGTKGKRKIGRYCRVMIHGVMAGQHGYLADVENEFKETKAIQKMYVRALSDETNMSETYVRKLMNKKSNVYLNAEEAVKLGIADIIF
jgi:ATP-dependent Clp endopeptidase proteolytic subunit ClpP|tara:strand:+ start:186 stop:866 length:681 start_codon:yes stop_codon:yes gene_type:complete